MSAGKMKKEDLIKKARSVKCEKCGGNIKGEFDEAQQGVIGKCQKCDYSFYLKITGSVL